MNDLRALAEKHREPLGFMLVGAFNTVLTWLVYAGLNRLMPYEVSYAISYAVGIVSSYTLNTRWVFRVPMSWKTFLQFPSVYLAQYLLGAVLVYLMVEQVGVPEDFAPLTVLGITIPVTFTISRFILRKKPAAATAKGAEDGSTAAGAKLS